LIPLVKKSANDVNHGFLNRIFRTSMILSFFLGVVAAFYFGWRVGLDFTVAAVWGTLSLKFLQLFILEASRPEGIRMERLILAAVLKFPILYGSGILYMVLTKPRGGAILAGFSLVLVVIVLKSLGRALIDSEWFSRPVSPRGGRH
jgi:hypothetical protein